MREEVTRGVGSSTVENQNKFLVEKSAEEQRIIDEARKKVSSSSGGR